jgi:hypothetical protein
VQVEQRPNFLLSLAEELGAGHNRVASALRLWQSEDMKETIEITDWRNSDWFESWLNLARTEENH